MTGLLKNVEKDNKVITSPFIEKRKLDLKSSKNKQDLIQTYISKMELDKHPETVPQILEEMNLMKFYQQLQNHPDYSTVKVLADNRILNFYEGATRGSIASREVKIGLVVCLMASTVFADRDNLIFPNAAKNPCILYPRMKCSLLSFNMGSMSSADIVICEKIITYLSKSAVPTQTGMMVDKLGTYILNAFRMWVLSDDQELLKFVLLGRNRLDHLKENIAQKLPVRIDVPRGISNVPTLIDLSNFDTVWSKTKNMLRNGAAKIKQINTYM